MIEIKCSFSYGQEMREISRYVSWSKTSRGGLRETGRDEY